MMTVHPIICPHCGDEPPGPQDQLLCNDDRTAIIQCSECDHSFHVELCVMAWYVSRKLTPAEAASCGLTPAEAEDLGQEAPVSAVKEAPDGH